MEDVCFPTPFKSSVRFYSFCGQIGIDLFQICAVAISYRGLWGQEA